MTVITIVLAVAYLLQWALFAWFAKAGADERRRMLHAIVTGTPAEYVAVERAVTRTKKAKKSDILTPNHPIGL